MAVFIKKERLGSGASQPQGRPGQILHRIEKLSSFQALKESYAQAKEAQAAELKDKYESNAEVQRWRTQMTKEEKARDAIERMIPTAKAVEEMRSGGKEVSYEDARRKAEQIAYQAERRTSDKKE